ncbi:hypothetical protein C8J57DRAFT_1095160 [Mycena rebaudengoi]|nr:hypothetical protein C8J57DRAFT_1095160 [Mycena rebaudengoi]
MTSTVPNDPETSLSTLFLPDLSTHNERKCWNCGTNDTPLWRRHPVHRHWMCNACGLYLSQRKKDRPVNLGEPMNDIPVATLECDNCHTKATSVWRRGMMGERVCNACGVYERTRGIKRPPEMRSDLVRRRARHPKFLPYTFIHC